MIRRCLITELPGTARLRLRLRAPAALLAAIVGAALGAACSGEAHDVERLAPVSAAEPIPSPAGDDSGEPNLFVTRDGRVLLNWTAALPEGGHALRYSVWDGTAWAEPQTIATGTDWFVNWADFPSLIELPDGSLGAHWLVRSAATRYAYDVHIARSFDDGTSWTPPITPHDDGTPTEHGFVSLFPHDGDLGAVWLDGRNFAGVDTTESGGHGGHADMTLRFGTVTAAGGMRGAALLDARTCECCQTTAALTEQGPVIAYRGRTADEIRDIYVVRFVDGRWTEPRPLHADGWQIGGCPVNGPHAAAAGHRVAIAWFTVADDVARVNVAFSADAGQSFGAPIRIDDGDPSGRVATVLLADGTALVSWLERTATGAEVRVRRVASDGRVAPAMTVTATSGERASGFPRMAHAGDGRLIFAWTEPGSPRRIRTAVANVPIDT